MEQFNLQEKTRELISELEELKEPLTILKWFYEAINYHYLFESEYLAKRIYNHLTQNGYTPITTSVLELEVTKSLLKKDYIDNKDKVGEKLISLILKRLEENSALGSLLEQFICLYNETYNKESTFTMMMNNLEKSIGEGVTFVIIFHGQLKLLTGIIEEVEPFKSVTISGEKYPFVGYEVEINKISSNYGKILYNNSCASINDDLVDVKEIEKRRAKLFGNSEEEPKRVAQ